MKANMVRLLVLLVLAVSSCEPAGRTGFTEYVDPFIGTGGHGHTFPGATLPFGMVQLGPDTRLTGWDGCSAYHYSDDILYGFSHTHLSGTGCSDYGDVLLMPVTGEVRLGQCADGDPATAYCSRFDHASEKASPGYYSVFLDDYGVRAELTVTERAGFHRYTCQRAGDVHIVVDLAHRDPVIDSHLGIRSDTEIEGFRISRAWAKEQHVYFVARFSRPFRTYDVTDGEIHAEGEGSVSGKNVRGAFTIGTRQDKTILVKVGISAVSMEGARRNLDAEIEDWDFDSIRRKADAAWHRALGRIRIKGGSAEQRTVFYTSLYHSLIAPNLYMDVDGRYRGRDLEIHAAKGFDNYTVFSLWDTYRATHPLFVIIEPERTNDFIRTFLVQYEQGGMLPVWELAANETGCMIGYHAVPVIADAYIKGIRGYDTAKALEAMKHSADQDHLGLEFYRKYGYIPADKEGESVSKTLEYAYDDWCIAQMAKALGEEADYRRFIRRAQYYKNIFDPSTGFMRAKMNCAWHNPFDPSESNFNYTEANSWQYSFYVPQDVSGLMALMGGSENFAKKLDDLFSASSEVSGLGQPDISGMIGQYAHGNEPSHHMAYLYSYAGRPWKTQAVVRKIMDDLYTTGPAGLCGNEDCGQMSSWYVLSALGFYPVTPGSDIYVIGTPLFEEAAIELPGGKRFIVRAEGVSGDNIYIRSATLNGRRYTKSYLRHADITGGGELVFEMAQEPDTTWGSGPDDLPVSAITDFQIQPVPYLARGERAFSGSQTVALAAITDDTAIHYTLDGTEPTLSSNRYTAPFMIRESTTLRAFAYRYGYLESFAIEAEFNRIPPGRSITLATEYSPMYTAGGDFALIDGIRGGENFRTMVWQGYQGVDIDAVVDLGGTQRINRISAGFLQDQNSWIFMPVEVEFAVSGDGEEFTPVANLIHDIPEDHDGPVLFDFTKDGLHNDARYVRVRARNMGVCPSWHKAAGHKSWIFSDEIVIE